MQKTVCIVGHGPSTQGRELGKIIDSYDIVIRMVECDWQDELDYGKKYNIGVFSSGVSFSQARKAKRKPSDKYWYYLTKGKHLENQYDSYGAYRQREMITLRKTVWKYKQKNHKFSRFTRGTAAVIAAVEFLKPKEIALVGFDTVMKGIPFSDHPNHPNAERISKSHYVGIMHSWGEEKGVIESFKNEVNINLL